jgi:hypothetical protein
MRMRTQVKIEDTGIYLYSHWGSSEILQTVKRAIAKRWRWDDYEYLTRIIFDEMMGKDSHGEETGFGIGTQQHGDIDNLVIVNCKEK